MSRLCLDLGLHIQHTVSNDRAGQTMSDSGEVPRSDTHWSSVFTSPNATGICDYPGRC